MFLESRYNVFIFFYKDADNTSQGTSQGIKVADHEIKSMGKARYQQMVCYRHYSIVVHTLRLN